MRRNWLIGGLLLTGLGLAPVATVFASDSPIAATTALEMNQGRPIVQLMVNGKGPYPFILDTGASGLIVSKQLVDELGLQVIGTEKSRSPIGEEDVDVDVVTVDSISLAGKQREGMKALIIDLPLDEMGVIGPAVFADEGRFQIDFAKGEVEIGGAASSAEDIRWIPFGESDPLLDVPIDIGGVEIVAHLDTGSPNALAVPQQWADQLPLLGPVQVVGKARTFDREFEIRAAPTDAIARFGNAEVPLRDIMFFDVDIANLGSRAMGGLTLEYDFAGQRFSVRGKGQLPTGGPQRVVVTEKPKEN